MADYTSEEKMYWAEFAIEHDSPSFTACLHHHLGVKDTTHVEIDGDGCVVVMAAGYGSHIRAHMVDIFSHKLLKEFYVRFKMGEDSTKSLLKRYIGLVDGAFKDPSTHDVTLLPDTNLFLQPHVEGNLLSICNDTIIIGLTGDIDNMLDVFHMDELEMLSKDIIIIQDAVDKLNNLGETTEDVTTIVTNALIAFRARQVITFDETFIEIGFKNHVPIYLTLPQGMRTILRDLAMIHDTKQFIILETALQYVLNSQPKSLE